mgnify:CR=1 FL=1
MITLEELMNGDKREVAARAALTVGAMIRTARLALENDTSGEDSARSVATVLELAEAISEYLYEGADRLQHETKRGIYAPEATGA